MSSPTRGRFLLINNSSFKEPSSEDPIDQSERRGSEVDVKNVVNVFKALSFQHDTVHNNLSGQVSFGMCVTMPLQCL